MKLVKVHKILTFNQSPWLTEYIDFDTHKRTLATNDFQKAFFKLLNNAMLGKTMQNVRHRRNIDIINGNEKKFEKLINQPTFKSFQRFDDNLSAVERLKA